MDEVPLDWFSIMRRYVDKVMLENPALGAGCLLDPDLCPEWTPAEREAIMTLAVDLVTDATPPADG